MIYSLIRIAIISYLALIALLFMMQRHLLYLPSKDTRTPPPQAEIIRYTTADGFTLSGWLLKPQTQNSADVVIVYFQGNAGHLSDRVQSFTKILDAGYAVFLVGYRGYSGNVGSPSEDGLYNDARAAITKIKQSYQNIVLMGESLGTGVAIQMALENPDMKGIILESPYLSIPAVAAHHYWYVPFLKHLVFDKFDSESKINALQQSILFLVAGLDDVVPVAQSEALFQKASTKKVLKIYADANHAQVMDDSAQDDIILFLEGL